MLTEPCGHRLYGPSSLASTAYTQLYRYRPGCRGDEVYRPLSYQLPNSKLASLRIALPRSSSSPHRFLSETSARQSLLSCNTATGPSPNSGLAGNWTRDIESPASLAYLPTPQPSSSPSSQSRPLIRRSHQSRLLLL
ncbi:hypothetical protein NXS19_001037 [Fusarium pseudograminearum]|nr:hypothetical protein NXS19_001037 [Fusarium pseudograminearum]